MDKPDENTPLGRLTIFAAETNDYTIRAAQFRPDVRALLDALASRPSPLVDTGEALREADEATVSHIAKAVSKETGTSYFLVRRVARAVLAALAAHPKPEEG